MRKMIEDPLSTWQIRHSDLSISPRRTATPRILNADLHIIGDNAELFNNSLPGCSVSLTALVRDWTEDARRRFLDLFRKGQICGEARMRLGEVEVLPKTSFVETTLVKFTIDGRIFDELEEHDVLMLTGGPFAPMYWV